MAQTLSSGRRGVLFTPFPTNVNHYTVTAAKTITVPASTTGVILSPDADIWLSTTGTAVVPSSDVTDGTGSFCLTKGTVRGFDVTPGQTISVISATGTAHVGVCWFI